MVLFINCTCKGLENEEIMEIKIQFESFESADDLDTESQALLKLSEDAMQQAYAPYSEFKVGAAVKLANGKIITGNNQENAAYPSGLCAERVALFHASAMNPGAVIESIYISCQKDEKICAPCGSCRQVISQYEIRQQRPIDVYFPGGMGKIFKVHGIQNLLPFPFSL